MADFICPICDLLKRGSIIHRQEIANLMGRFRLKVSLRDLGDDLVTFAAPSHRLSWNEGCERYGNAKPPL